MKNKFSWDTQPESVILFSHSTTPLHPNRYGPPMKIFALVVLSILAGTFLLVGSSYLDIYFRLFEASFMLRPVMTVSVVLAVALFLGLGNSRSLARWWHEP